MASGGFTVFKDGKKLEAPAKVQYKLITSEKKSNLVVLAQWNEPGTYKVTGDPRNQTFKGVTPPNQIKMRERIDEVVELLHNPTIVHPSFETVAVFVPPPAPMFFQPPPMMGLPPAPMFFQPPPMMGLPPAPPTIFFPRPPFQ